MDLNKEIRSFTTIDIEKFTQNNVVSEKIINSVKSYNKAIEYLKTGSEDIAIIELKRVVSINPDFYEAVNLLGLCYAYTNQMDKAEDLFDKVAKGENNSIKAVEYLNYIGVGDNNFSKKNIKTKPVNKPNNELKKEPVKKGNYADENVQSEYLIFKKIGMLLNKPSVAGILSFISVLCLIVSIVLFISSTKGTEKVNTTAEPAIDTQSTAAYDSVVEENKSLTKQLEAANVKLKQNELATSITQVSVLYGQRKYVSAADLLLSLPVNDLSADLKTKYDDIKGDVLLKAANQLTNEGYTLYNSKKYSEAINKLEKVFTLGDKWTFSDQTLYILGKSYVQVNELQKGVEAFQKLIDEYPKSAYYKFTKSRLEYIQ